MEWMTYCRRLVSGGQANSRRAPRHDSGVGEVERCGEAEGSRRLAHSGVRRRRVAQGTYPSARRIVTGQLASPHSRSARRAARHLLRQLVRLLGRSLVVGRLLRAGYDRPRSTHHWRLLRTMNGCTDSATTGFIHFA